MFKRSRAITGIVLLSYLCLTGCAERRARQLESEATTYVQAEKRSASSLSDHFRSSNTKNLHVYVDITPSTAKAGADKAYWDDVRLRVIAFLNTAAPGSHVDIWVTGRDPGRPVLKYKDDVKAHRRERDEQIEKADRQIKAIHESLLKSPPVLPYSSIIEDVYWVATQGSTLPGATEVIVTTDAQQFSPNLRCSQILAGKDDEQAIIQRLLPTFPAFPVPPAKVTLVYHRGNITQGDITPKQEEVLQGFYRQLFRTWGTNYEITEPHQLDVE